MSDQVWVGLTPAERVIAAAIEYEERWTDYADYRRTPHMTEEARIIAKAEAHNALMRAVRDYERIEGLNGPDEDGPAPKARAGYAVGSDGTDWVPDPAADGPGPRPRPPTARR